MQGQTPKPRRSTGRNYLADCRGAIVRLPAKAAENHPLIVALHGGTFSSRYFDVPGFSLFDHAELLGLPMLGTNVSIDVPSVHGLPFHYVVSGACCLEAGSESMELTAGDFVKLSRLPHYRFRQGNDARTTRKRGNSRLI